MLSTYKYIEYKTTRKNDVKNVKILYDVHMWPIQRSHRTSLENDTVRDISNKGDLMVFPCCYYMLYLTGRRYIYFQYYPAAGPCNAVTCCVCGVKPVLSLVQ